MKSPKIGGYKLPGKVPAGANKYTADKIEKLPPKVDLRKYMTAVEEQVGNSCVANALAGAYEYLTKRELEDETDVSRLFVYYNARYLDDMHGEDCGSYMETAIKGLKEYGACSEHNWPNQDDLILEEPNPDAYSEAEGFKIIDSKHLETDLNVWKSALAEGYPIAFALNTFDSFDEACKNKGRVPMPKKTDNVRETHGWHAMLAVGYSDPDKVFIVRNSWGEAWGDKGYCYIPYDYVIHKDYNGNDSWIIKAIDESNYGEDVWDEDESSSFTDEESTVIEDFYLLTADPDGFLEDLEALLEEYVDSEENYYFDYEVSEEDEDGNCEISMNDFYLDTEDEDGFLEALEELCVEYAVDDEEYEYQVAGYEDEEEEDDDDVEEDEDEEEEEEEEDEDDEEEEDEDDEEEEDEDDEEEEDDEDEEEEDDEDSSSKRRKR